MERKTNEWGWDSPSPSTTEGQTESVINQSGQAVSTTVECRAREPTDAEALEMLSRYYHSRLRSELAQAVYPWDKQKYGTESQWRRTVGKKVCEDIHNDALLCRKMYALGYQPRQIGYTDRQIVLLAKYYYNLLKQRQ